MNLSDEELLEKSKSLQSNAIVNALLIGFLIGIIIWSVAKNTWGFLSLIPLYYLYKMVNNSKNDEVLNEVLKERNLK